MKLFDIFNFADNYLLIFSTIISFLLFTFAIEGFKFSENKIIIFLQKTLIIILLGIVVQLLFTFNVGVEYAAELSPEEADKLKDLVKNKEINIFKYIMNNFINLLNSLEILQFFILFLLGFFISIFSDIFNLNIKNYLRKIFNIILLILLIISILEVFNLNILDIFPHVLLDEKDINVNVEGTKININALPEAATALGNAAAFNAGLGAATALVKKTSLPIGVKFGIIFASGAGSVLTFNGAKVASKLLWGVDKNKIAESSHIVSTQNSNGAFEAKITSIGESVVKCPLEKGDTLDSLKELLNITLGLEVCIIILLIYSIIMLIFINIAKKELALNWTSQIPFGKKIKYLILFLKKTWGNLNITYLYISISISLIFSIFNAGFIQVILYTLTNF